ncbi:hypothetical protein PG994_012675 [Apiospora phragmitis]|uniref:NmrA-like domain-containing protein n=1 Tax=Apiospora phragmitis TaxID=2905665 RepID=A0ABR1TBQ5_9PEZI
MAPAILVIGATGSQYYTKPNISEFLKEESSGSPFAGHRILALTRSAQGAAAQQLATLPGVEVVEFPWADVTEAWLRAHAVARVFVASAVALAVDPAQFSTESGFLVAARAAGVEYVVRISTTAANVRPDCDAYYARTHCAIEAMLGSSAFEKLKWTSLAFFTAGLFVKKVREAGGRQDELLRLIGNPDAPVGIIDADDIGLIAARLLVCEDPSAHHHVVNGPEYITGRQMLAMVEQQIGAPVRRSSTKMCPRDGAAVGGEALASTTSKEILEIAAPQSTPAASWVKVLKALEM